MKKIILIGTILFSTGIIVYAAYQHYGKNLKTPKELAKERDYLPYLLELKRVGDVMIPYLEDDTEPVYIKIKKDQQTLVLIIDSVKEERRTGVVSTERNYFPHIKSLYGVYQEISQHSKMPDKWTRYEAKLLKVRDSMLSEMFNEPYDHNWGFIK